MENKIKLLGDNCSEEPIRFIIIPLSNDLEYGLFDAETSVMVEIEEGKFAIKADEQAVRNPDLMIQELTRIREIFNTKIKELERG